MSEGRNSAAQAKGSTRRITIERSFEASAEEVWELWTTKAGFESWWGPEGFSVEVRKLDLRPGGELRYAMIATGAPQIEFMKRQGMPLTTETGFVFVEIEAPRRLVYKNLVDFVPGVAPYEAGTEVTLQPDGDRVRLVVTLDALHEEQWTQRAVMGWESQLEKLRRKLA